jgi:TolB-like protein
VSVFAELKRRNVVRVGLAYTVIGWVLAQVAEFAFENFGAPEWVLKTIIVILLLGLPLALLFAWAFELTPEGLKREKNVVRDDSITHVTGRKLDFTIFGVLILAVGFLLFDKFVAPPAEDSSEVAATSQKQSIAVLPFANLSDDKDYLADGLSEELLNLLVKIPDLKVPGRTSSFKFKGHNEDLRIIGEALDVEHVLEGSVRRAGERIRITAQLIKVSDGYHLWSETYDRTMDDIIDIQDDVAGKIATALKVHLAPEKNRTTSNPEAYALYLQAIAASNTETGDVTPIIEIIDRALEIDPGFAKAHELKAMIYYSSSGWTIESPVAQLLVNHSATAAIALDPTLVVAKSLAITSGLENWDWITEMAAIEDSANAMPSSVIALDSLAYDLLYAGYFEEGLEVAKRTVELDPLSSFAVLRVANALTAMGRDDDALRYINEASNVFPGDAAINEFWIWASQGRYDEAANALERYNNTAAGRDRPNSLNVDQAANRETGEAYLSEWIAEQSEGAENFSDIIVSRSYYLVFGYIDAFWREIGYFSLGPSKGWSNSDLLEYFCTVLPGTGCRAHSKYVPQLSRWGMHDLWDKRGAPDHCSKESGEWVCT